MHRRPAAALGLLAFGIVFASGAGGQTPGPELFDKVSSQTLASHVQCHVHPRWIVVEKPLREDLASDFFLRPASSKRCDVDSLAGDFVLRNQWAAYFCGIREDVLFLDRGTGPDERLLILYDLEARKKMTEIRYTPDGGVIRGRDSLTLGVWVPADMRATVPKCPPREDGMTLGVDSLFWLNVRTGQTRFACRTRCVGKE